MRILGLRTTIYNVDDLEAAKSWYSKAFETQPYFDEPFYVGFNIGGYELGLVPQENDLKAVNILCYWGVENVQKVYNELLDLGAKTHEAPHNVGGEIEVCTVFDPWENIIGLIYNPDFKINE